MAKSTPGSVSARLRNANARVADAFASFREAARAAGPLDAQTIEFILMAGFATAGRQEPFKNHARRCFEAGVAKEALQQVVIATLGATAILADVANALAWIDEVYQEYREERAAPRQGS